MHGLGDIKHLSGEHVDLSSDIQRELYEAVLVRVAWTMVSLKVAPDPDVLHTALLHVWLCLPRDEDLTLSVDRAEHLTREFVARARGEEHEEAFPDELEMPLPASWREALVRDLVPLSRWLLRYHYADGLSLTQLASAPEVELAALEASREGLREVLRNLAKADGTSLESWSGPRLDVLLRRLAAMAPPDGPPLIEIVDGMHPGRASECTRAARAQALLESGHMAREAFVVPLRRTWPESSVRVAAVQMSRDSRTTVAALTRSLEGRSTQLAGKLMLMECADAAAVGARLVRACEAGRPRRDHVRGVVIDAAGAWTNHGLVGPVVSYARLAVRGVSWGEVKGLVELPEPRSGPVRGGPAAAIAIATLGLCWWIMQPPPPTEAVFPLMGGLTPARGGVWLDVDVDDAAYLLVVREQSGVFDALLPGLDAGEKVALATGDGSYRAHVVADGVCVVSSWKPFHGVEPATGWTLQDYVDAAEGQFIDSLCWRAPLVGQ